MPRFYLGADIRFAALAFGYTSVFAGLFMRFVMNGHSDIGFLLPAVFALATIGVLCMYRGSAAHFLAMCGLLTQNPKDQGAFDRMKVLMAMRRKLAASIGMGLGVTNNSVVMLLNGGDVFSYESLIVIFIVTVIGHWGWFGRGAAA